MAGWKKVKTDQGEGYVISEFINTYELFDDRALEKLNSNSLEEGETDIEYSITENPNIIRKSSPTEGIDLPVGTYILRASHSYDPVILYDFVPSHDKVLFELDAVKEVLEDFSYFSSKESVYRDLGILYKRGVLLFGEPGTGKTTAIQMIVDKVRSNDSIIIWITGEIPLDLIRVLKTDIRSKILIFEELTNTIKEHNLGKFLTFLDGENSLDNVYIIGTTNYPENLPGNVVDRPGRFDKLCRIGNLNSSDRSRYLEHFLNRSPSDNELLITKDMPIAALKEIMILMKLKDITIEEALSAIKKHKNEVKKNFKKNATVIGFSDDDD